MNRASRMRELYVRVRAAAESGCRLARRQQGGRVLVGQAVCLGHWSRDEFAAEGAEALRQASDHARPRPLRGRLAPLGRADDVPQGWQAG